MSKVFLWVLCALTIATIGTAVPHHYRDGAFHPVANFFKNLRKVREQSTNVNSDTDSTAGPTEELEQPQSSTSSTLSPTSSTPSGGSSPDLTTTKTTSTTPENFFVTTKPPYSADVDRINNGVSTILNGVMTLDLAQILRGAFIFPKSHKVKSVANNVIDTIFGPPPTPLNGAGSGIKN